MREDEEGAGAYMFALIEMKTTQHAIFKSQLLSVDGTDVQHRKVENADFTKEEQEE